LPQTGNKTFGKSDFIRVPLPAAKITAFFVVFPIGKISVFLLEPPRATLKKRADVRSVP
jgi:hypothetical protein